jgi:hypothetical protein
VCSQDGHDALRNTDGRSCIRVFEEDREFIASQRAADEWIRELRPESHDVNL